MMQEIMTRNPKLQQRTMRIRQIADRAYIAICREVAAGKDEAESYQEWVKWTHDEFGWTERHVCRMVNIVDMVGSTDIDVSKISNTALMAIAAPSVPPKAREEVVERSTSGEQLTVAQTQEIIRKAKEEARQEALRQEQAKREQLIKTYNDRIAHLQAANGENQGRIQSLEQRVQEKEAQLRKGAIPLHTQKELLDLKEQLRIAKQEKQQLGRDLEKERIAAKERFLENREAENQDRIRRQWAQDTRDYVNACKQVFVRWPSLFDAASAFEEDDRQRLSQLIAAAYQVAHAGETLLHDLNEHVISSDPDVSPHPSQPALIIEANAVEERW